MPRFGKSALHEIGVGEVQQFATDRREKASEFEKEEADGKLNRDLVHSVDLSRQTVVLGHFGSEPDGVCAASHQAWRASRHERDSPSYLPGNYNNVSGTTYI